MLSLSSLTDAILLNVWQHVLGDLPTHIALSQTCRRLREVFERDDAIWQSACFTAGFGRPLRKPTPPDTPDAIRRLSYRNLARMLVSHTVVCEIGSCTKANGCFAEHYEQWPYTRTRPLHHDLPLNFHPLYYYLHFAQPSSPTQSRHAIQPYTPTPSPSPSPTPPAIPDALSILLTHLPTFPESRFAQYGPLCTHPNASCAFATFPPVDRLEFENGQGDIFMIVENPEGCTVLDVNRALAALVPFDDQHLEFAFGHYQDLAFTSGLSIRQLAEAVSRDRGFMDDHEYPFLQHIVANM